MKPITFLIPSNPATIVATEISSIALITGPKGISIFSITNLNPSLIFSNISFNFFLFSSLCKNFIMLSITPKISAGPNNFFSRSNKPDAVFATALPAPTASALGAPFTASLALANLSLACSLNDFFSNCKFSLSIAFCSCITS